MSFKNFLKEFYNIETGQGADAHEPNPNQSSSIMNPEVLAKINVQLITELNERTLSPQSGIQKIRKVLHSYALDFPVSYDVEPEGDEFIIEVTQFGKAFGPTPFSTEMTNDSENVVFLYVLYFLTDDGYYEFYAEISPDVARMEELQNSDLEEDEED